MPRQHKSDPRARLCYFLNFDCNHGHDCHKLLGVETGNVVFRATLRGTIQRRRLSLRQMQSGIRPLRHRMTSTCRCQRLCPASPRRSRFITTCSCASSITDACLRSCVDTRTTYAKTPRLRSPRALASSWRMRDTWRCPGGRVARPAQCTMHDGNTSITMVYHWTMRPWCRCWTRVKRCTRSYTNTAPLRTCRPCVHQTCTLRQTFLRRRRHRTRIYGDTQ